MKTELEELIEAVHIEIDERRTRIESLEAELLEERRLLRSAEANLSRLRELRSHISAQNKGSNLKGG